jgi:TFIIF-interacting CTD phosphatase-like protein
MKTSKEKLVLLDLDNTVICAEDLDNIKDSDKIEKARQAFSNVRMIDYYDIFERPHLQEFLDFVFQHFRVGIWTASSKDYAIFVTQNCIIKDKQDRHIELFLCSHHCNVSKRNFKVSKDLKLLSDKWKLAESKDVILIDDLEELAKHQPNVMAIKPFFYDDQNAHTDKELLRIKTLLQQLL